MSICLNSLCCFSTNRLSTQGSSSIWMALNYAELIIFLLFATWHLITEMKFSVHTSPHECMTCNSLTIFHLLYLPLNFSFAIKMYFYDNFCLRCCLQIAGDKQCKQLTLMPGFVLFLRLCMSVLTDRVEFFSINYSLAFFVLHGNNHFINATVFSAAVMVYWNP